jgi:hypothetical protein
MTTMRSQALCLDMKKVSRAIAQALEMADTGLTQIHAGGPQLVERWESADAYAKAVLTAAIDATRAGEDLPLQEDLLRDSAAAYCTPRQRAAAPRRWFEAALTYATTPVDGGVALLYPVSQEMGEVDGYVVSDYLMHLAKQQQITTKAPATTEWPRRRRSRDVVRKKETRAENAGDLGVETDSQLLWERLTLLLSLAAEFLPDVPEDTIDRVIADVTACSKALEISTTPEMVERIARELLRAIVDMPPPPGIVSMQPARTVRQQEQFGVVPGGGSATGP